MTFVHPSFFGNAHIHVVLRHYKACKWRNTTLRFLSHFASSLQSPRPWIRWHEGETSNNCEWWATNYVECAMVCGLLLACATSVLLASRILPAILGHRRSLRDEQGGDGVIDWATRLRFGTRACLANSHWKRAWWPLICRPREFRGKLSRTRLPLFHVIHSNSRSPLKVLGMNISGLHSESPTHHLQIV